MPKIKKPQAPGIEDVSQGISEGIDKKIIDFQTVNDHLLNMGGVHSASELQGYLSGLLCGGKKLTDAAWINDALIFLDLEGIGGELESSLESQNQDSSMDFDEGNSGDPLTKQLLKDLHATTAVQLADDEYSFAPLLPEDSSSLERRTEELGAWCQGFLHGVGASGMKGDKALSPEASEAIRDLAEISQVDADFGDSDNDDSEENEVHLVELIEYVRAAVLTFRGDNLLSDTVSPGLAAKLASQEPASPGHGKKGASGAGKLH